MAGVLYVVATPIGNLEDITLRARRILGEVALIAAEDTRRTGKLLAHFQIRTPMTSLREHNEAREAPRLIARLEAGDDVALVSDAGTPGIADPGARVVQAAHAHHVRVVPIPGPSAVVAALSISGFDISQFVFLGFPPAKGRIRTEWLEQLRAEPRAAVFFEAPHRVRKTLVDMANLFVERQILCCRELSKINEISVVWDKISNLSDLREQGEFVFVVGPIVQAPSKQAESQLDPGSLTELLGKMTTAGIERDEAIQLIALKHKTDERVVAKMIKKYLILVKQHNHKTP